VEVPVRPGTRPVKVSLDTIAANRALVKPYPFDLDPLTVSFSARLIPNRAYKNPEDFLEEFYRAERLTITHALASA
jgi:hypothetical protein